MDRSMIKKAIDGFIVIQVMQVYNELENSHSTHSCGKASAARRVS